MANLRAGMVGIGSMGKNHVRNLRAIDGVDLVAIADASGKDPFGVAGD
ncbi:gfo/Idh/MocA family oxidoreductase, partial [Klebsiella pneumoniae]|nr:gfo/Idh/MocA family oxidoreductase [Klebsiella pneumoniae]